MFAAVLKQSMCPSLGRISGRFLGSRTTDAPSWLSAHPVTPAAVPVPARGDSQPNPHVERKRRGFSALPPSSGSDGSSVCPPRPGACCGCCVPSKWVLCTALTPAQRVLCLLGASASPMALGFVVQSTREGNCAGRGAFCEAAPASPS